MPYGLVDGMIPIRAVRYIKFDDLDFQTPVSDLRSTREIREVLLFVPASRRTHADDQTKHIETPLIRTGMTAMAEPLRTRRTQNTTNKPYDLIQETCPRPRRIYGPRPATLANLP